MNVETYGWFPIHEVCNLCLGCQWKYADRHMVSCEFGEPRFPNASVCNSFKKEDDES